MDTDDLISALVRTDAVRYGEFELASGGTSDYYVDMYRAATDPAALATVGEAVGEHVDDRRLAGVALGGVPLVVAASLETGNPYVIDRGENKGHGTANRIEGELSDDESVVLVEDVTTTGHTALDSVRGLRDAGAVVDRAVTVVDREAGASERFEDAGVELRSLLTASDLFAAEGRP